ncbi:IS4 family transposase [Lelliottia sp. V106_10]|nr:MULTISPECIES: IS4 family transposase [unclassified Lelliottia]MDK9358855.1 IS4 family transposase [Lelliottia sp. V106_16]MDK9373542.1 IS4 family transposase [Lelliottia sp. V106_10]MDK9600417.1 IS4 family transposase [Lelliottia sp. V106_5]
MPVRSLCQKFFRDVLRPFHQYRRDALLDATAALSRGASLTLTSIGRYLPGNAQVKHKIKRIDRLLGNSSLHQDIPAIFHNITRLLTHDLSLCLIAVDWSGYPSQAFHVLRASLVCDGRSMPLLSQVVPSSRQQHAQVHKAFLNALAAAIGQDKKVIIVTDAGFQSAWFRHVRSLGWDFVGRIRGNVQFRLDRLPEMWLKLKMLKASDRAKYLGSGTLVKAEYGRCEGHFYFHKRAARDRKNQRARCRISRYSQEKAGREAAKEPWLIFSSTDEFKPKEIMKLVSVQREPY